MKQDNAHHSRYHPSRRGSLPHCDARQHRSYKRCQHAWLFIRPMDKSVDITQGLHRSITDIKRNQISRNFTRIPPFLMFFRRLRKTKAKAPRYTGPYRRSSRRNYSFRVGRNYLGHGKLLFNSICQIYSVSLIVCISTDRARHAI